MNKDHPSVSVIIPNWNGRVHLQTCLDSLSLQTLPPRETIMVDNGSTDDSVEFVKEKYPWVSILPLERNTGFARAINQGINNSRGELIATLNNDTEVERSWLHNLATVLLSEQSIGSVACKMLDFHDRSRIDSAGDGLTYFAAPYARGYGYPDGQAFDKRSYVFGACAGAAMYRRSLFDVVGLFDEDFVSYFEDIDLAFRAQLAGYRCMYVPEAICYHKRNATGRLISHYPLRMQGRNMTAFFVKNLPWQILAPKLPFMIASRVRWLVAAAREDAIAPALKGLAEGIKLIPIMFKKRRRIQSSRKVSIGYLKSAMKREF